MSRPAAVLVAVAGACLALVACVGGGRSGASDTAGSTSTTDPTPYRLDISPAAETLLETHGLVGADEIRTIADRAFSRLPHRTRITIAVDVDTVRAIPEIGIGGFTDPLNGNVSIWIADHPPAGDSSEALRTWLHMIVAHELHHSSRVRFGPGYGLLLGEAMVTEGLADSFALEVVTDAPRPPWVDALTPAERGAAWRLARDELWFPYDHGDWFFGTGDVARWAGYSIGFDAAQAHLSAAPDRTAVTEFDVPAHEVLDPYEP